MLKRIAGYLFVSCIIGSSCAISYASSGGEGSSLSINVFHPTRLLRISKILEQPPSVGPKNEFGYDQDEAYVSDLKAYWSFSSLHYYRFTQAGIFGARVNYANKYAIAGEQYQLEAYPKIFPESLPGSYINLVFGLSNTSQQVYPH